MSNQEIKSILIAFALLTFFSCNDKTHEERFLIYKNLSTKISGSSYYETYHVAVDSLYNWKNNKLSCYQYLSLYPFKLDSLLCFNKSNDRFVSTILVSDNDHGNNNNSDGLVFFYGVKIKGKWYFFSGATVVLPREFYQKDVSTPMSFEKLHEIAMQEVFSGYLVRKKKDAGFWKNLFAPEYEYEVNESWFDQIGTEKDYVFTKQDSLRMTPDLLDSILILKAYSNWLPESKQNIGYTAPSKWKYFYKTPYPLSIPWEQH